jgi:type V secretory pathway adhesin AidA
MRTPKKFWFILIGAILAMVIIACSFPTVTPTLTAPAPATAPASPTATVRPSATATPAATASPTVTVGLPRNNGHKKCPDGVD